ncbi:MAG: hypothetical protein ABII96_09890 [Candidatus Zixiibacteriota bacterium]
MVQRGPSVIIPLIQEISIVTYKGLHLLQIPAYNGIVNDTGFADRCGEQANRE